MKTPYIIRRPVTIVVLTYLFSTTNCTVTDDLIQLPVVTTNEVTNVTLSTAQCGGEVSSDGGFNISERGVCWSTGLIQTINDDKTIDGSDIGNFSSTLTGLQQNTAYYVRAYATNIKGTAYGSAMWFKTGFTYGTLKDRDGNNYRTVQIGSQLWMADNLKVTHYNDGTAIPNVINDQEWSERTSGALCDYNHNPSYSEIYGKLYNWYAVGTGKLCPAGWHVPNDAEWNSLINSLGGEAGVGGKLKEAGTTHWKNPNYGATNESGFTALPGSVRLRAGYFWSIGLEGSWWSASHTGSDHYGGYTWSLEYIHDSFLWSNASPKTGLSIRCIKD